MTQKVAKGDVVIVPAGSRALVFGGGGTDHLSRGPLAGPRQVASSQARIRPWPQPNLWTVFAEHRCAVRRQDGRGDRACSGPTASIVSPTGSCTTWPSAWADGWPRKGSCSRRSVRHPRAQRRALVRGLSRHPEAPAPSPFRSTPTTRRRRSRRSSAIPARSSCSSASAFGRSPPRRDDGLVDPQLDVHRTPTRTPGTPGTLWNPQNLLHLTPRRDPVHVGHDLGSEGRRADARQPAGRARCGLRGR